MTIREYWPGFVERDEEPRQQKVRYATDALSIPWLKEKGHLRIEGRFVMCNGWVVAQILED